MLAEPEPHSLLNGVLPFPQSGDMTSRELLEGHLRSLTANHLTDVVSSNQHTVKPRFGGRMDYTPPVKNLGARSAEG